LDGVHRRFGKGTGVVALIDTGVDPYHPQLKDRLVAGYDFVRDRRGTPSEWDDLDGETAAKLYDATSAMVQQSTVAVLDGWEPAVLNQSTVAVLDQKTIDLLSDPRYQAFGHGTMVAGLVHLVAPDARLMPLKAFRSDGTGDTASIAAAIYYAVDNGADVINMSFSFEDFSMEVMRALNYATRRGVVTIAAAGNRGESVMVFPAALGNVSGVAGLAMDGSRSEISNYGEDLVSVAAPGEELVSTYPGAHYAVGFGTSFSAALVSGAASLMLGISEDLRPADVERALALGRDSGGELGYGPLNLRRSLEWVRSERRDDDDDDHD
jgi:subtilisin family serine protease